MAIVSRFAPENKYQARPLFQGSARTAGCFQKADAAVFGLLLFCSKTNQDVVPMLLDQLTNEEIEEVEKSVNECITKNRLLE